VPNFTELRAWLERAHADLSRGARRTIERHGQRVATAHDRLRRAPLHALERKRARLENAHGRLRALSPQATLDRGYAIVRAGDELVRTPPPSGTEIDVKVAAGSFGARVE
jgi:exodeoxyribonuclease VII large subunit